ncbi:MAG TPA: hypothetical protein VHX14_02925 [Thermoanaerobaculia bacterium]|nr:hypothetical protein [Thermoanaerobaculia bacterium]
MNEVKKAFTDALERTALALDTLIGSQEIPKDPSAAMAKLKDRNFQAKNELFQPKEVVRARVAKLRRSDPKQGDWTLFRPEDAAEVLEMRDQMVGRAALRSADSGFLEALVQAWGPMQAVVEKYGTKTSDGWRFQEDSADVLEPFPDPPPAGT